MSIAETADHLGFSCTAVFGVHSRSTTSSEQQFCGQNGLGNTFPKASQDPLYKDLWDGRAAGLGDVLPSGGTIIHSLSL